MWSTVPAASFVCRGTGGWSDTEIENDGKENNYLSPPDQRTKHPQGEIPEWSHWKHPRSVLSDSHLSPGLLLHSQFFVADQYWRRHPALHLTVGRWSGLEAVAEKRFLSSPSPQHASLWTADFVVANLWLASPCRQDLQLFQIKRPMKRAYNPALLNVGQFGLAVRPWLGWKAEGPPGDSALATLSSKVVVYGHYLCDFDSDN